MSLFVPSQSIAAISSSYSGQQESANLTVADPGGAYEVQTIVPAAFASTAQGDFVIITNASGVATAIWLDKDADGTEPAGLLYAATDAQIEVDVVSGDTAAQIATKINTAISGVIAGFTTSVDNATVTLTATLKGNCTAPVRKNTAEDGNGSFTVATGTAGTDPTIQGKYVLVSSAGTNYSVWFSSNGNGSDPAVADTTAEECALLGNETTAGVATALAASINGLAGLTAEADGTRVIITGDTNANIGNVTAGDSGFTLEYRAQGNAVIRSPSSATTGMSVSPSTI